MRFSHHALWVILFASVLILNYGLAADPPRKSNGLTDVVQWDNYTLFVHSQRTLLYSGELHTFRLPVRELWLDIFQKMVAAGLNGGLLNPAPGVFDFEDWRSLQPMFDAAKLAGIFITLRPGQINAETTAGGLALWSTSLVEGVLRANSTGWNAAYKPYISEIIQHMKPNQVTEGGPVLYNEWLQVVESQAEYYADLEKQYHDGGIVVPQTTNDLFMIMQFVNGTGAADIYGLDWYPSRLNCSLGPLWGPVPSNLTQYHLETDPDRPSYLSEYQGGSHDYWGGPGYDVCRERFGADYEDVFYKASLANNVKMQSVYMFYGGTNWGGVPFPGAYTSYDYAGAIKESRFLWEKYDEIKRQAIFIRSSPSLRKTDWISDTDTTHGGISELNILGEDVEKVFGTYLRNPDTGTGFAVMRQLNGSSTDNISFKLIIASSRGHLMIPQHAPDIALKGRQSKVIVIDYAFGASGSVLYSTASVFFAGTIGKRDVLFVYGASDQSHEIALALSGSGTYVKSERLVLFADPVTAATFWAPAVRTQTAGTILGLEAYWQFGTNTTLLVGGPYLVRNASLEDGGRTLALRGDLNATVPLVLVVPETVRGVTWNGQHIPVSGTREGMLLGRLEVGPSVHAVEVPKISGWKFADSLPEVKDGFDDSDWAVADHTSTNITIEPAFGDGRVLCTNNILWRGDFTATGYEAGANLSINGGTAFAASVWLNDVFLDTVSDFSSAGETNAFFAFPSSALRPGQENMLTVLQDHMGNGEEDVLAALQGQMSGSAEKSPRGIRGFELVGGVGKFSTWKVQGNLGGYTGFPDRVRGVLNEGGLFAERAGWHLPGFPLNDSSLASFTARDLSSGLPGGRAGVGFFVTTLELHVPENADTTFSFEFDGGAQQTGEPYRALLFVNGWKFGKRIGNVGPQARFPVPPGILDPTERSEYYSLAGDSTIAVALWVLGNTAVHPTLELALEGIVEGGVGPIAANNPGRKLRTQKH
ncbi:hypothetical protein BV20DRAFT_1033302 [Pilatotrama ljubarskyi]|nr:hypothetical protein BV20DRAFT_1033302 [Pilatotrama ljubarskyi]